MILVAGLCMFAFVLLIAIVFVARSGSSAQPQQAVQPSIFHPQPVYAVQKTAREQDREVQASMVAEWYAKSLDEQFRKDTLDDIAVKLAARK